MPEKNHNRNCVVIEKFSMAIAHGNLEPTIKLLEVIRYNNWPITVPMYSTLVPVPYRYLVISLKQLLK